jgi:hypothetical protein
MTMGLRFYRRFRRFPGVSLNLSKRRASVSLGERGAHVTVGTFGIRETVGLPGTGLSYTEHQGWSSQPDQPADPAQPDVLGSGLTPAQYALRFIGWLILFSALAAMLIAMLAKG